MIMLSSAAKWRCAQEGPPMMRGGTPTQPADEYCPVQAASLLGGLIGPALGGLLADVSGLRAPFTLTGCAALLAALYGAVRLPETMGTRKEAESASCAKAMPEKEVMVRASLTYDTGHLLPSLCCILCFCSVLRCCSYCNASADI